MRQRGAAQALAFGLLALLAGPARADDVAAGKAVFESKCAICHATAPQVSQVGPSLFGIVGRPAATVPDFAYSPALRGVDGTWTAERLDGFLTDPRTAVPGTRMVFPGLKSATDRAAVISFLGTLK